MKIITLGNGFALTKKKKIVMITENHDDAIRLLNISKQTKRLLKVLNK